jgi:NAD(P)-dependent dehydrogenase (short-subunit alcohol dehydrogenase family)
MNGKYCLVTGATHGIGMETARALATAGANVLVHGRDMTRASAIAETLSRETGNPEVRAVQADFARFAELHRLARELAASLPRLDVLINNAGVMSATRATSAEGYDLTFAVNHLAPFLLTNLLLPKLKECGAARIVVVASEAHRRATLDFDDLMNTKVSGLLPAYARSKLANILFTRALARRLAGTPVTVNALHPGFVNSHLFHDNAPLRVLFAGVGRFFMLTPAQGARTSIYLASSPEVSGASGGYYRDCRRVPPSAAAQSDADAERLWQESARLTGLSV